MSSLRRSGGFFIEAKQEILREFQVIIKKVTRPGRSSYIRQERTSHRRDLPIEIEEFLVIEDQEVSSDR